MVTPVRTGGIELPPTRPMETPTASPAPLVGQQPQPGSPPAVSEFLDNLPRRTTPRPPSTLSNRQEYSTLVSSHVRTAQSTSMERFALATADLQQPGKVAEVEAPTPGLFGRAISAVKQFAGIPEAGDWMKNTMRELRAQSIGANGATQAPGSGAALQALAGPSPVSAYWASPELAVHARFGPHKEALLAHIDTLAQAHGPEFALTVSLACLNAKTSLPHGAPHLDPSLFQALRDPALLPTLLAHDARGPAGPSQQLTLARAVLTDIARNDQFADLAKTLCPQVPEQQLPALKRYLEASDAVVKEAAGPHPRAPIDHDPEALEAGEGPGMKNLAARVLDNARAQLASDGTAPRSAGQVTDDFFWDNNFRKEGPKTELQELKNHIHTFFEQLAKAPEERGPLNSMYRYGLAGADRHTLADETAKLNKMVDTPEVDQLVGATRNKLVSTLQELAHRRDVLAEPGNDAVRGLATLVALEAWSPADKQALSLSDVVHGKRHEAAEGSPEAEKIALVCRQFLGNGRIDPSGTDPVTSPLYAHVAVRHLEARVRAEIGNLRLGFDAVLTLANRSGAELGDGARAMADKILGTIDARSSQPAEKTPAAAGAVVAEFLGNVQFGNHIKVTDAWSGGIANGTGVNLASSQFELESIQHPRRPLIVRGDLRLEGSLEHVFRAGAATHGGEMFMGQDVKWRAGGGAGIQSGYTALGDKDTVGRLAASLDVNAYGYDHSSYQGAMWRVDRKVVEDRDTPTGPKFAQNDAEVRATMSDMARLLHERAPQARDAVEREQLLEEFVASFAHRGLSVTLMKQESSSHRSDIALGGGVSATTDTVTGARFGLGASAAYEKGWSTSVSEKDTTGSYRINNVRSGWFERKRAGTNVGGNIYHQAVGLPRTPLGTAGATFGESGGSVRVRTPLRDGKIVPEKTFSDTETPDKNLFKQLVLNDHHKWIDLFAYPHRHLPPDEAQTKGREAVTAFFHKIENIREEHHVYYARERLHPEVAAKLDKLAMVEQQMPPQLRGAQAEVQSKREALVSADDSWGPASLIAYQRNVKQDGAGTDVSGIRAAHVSAVEGEREIVFDTPGWANLRQRERENTPPSLQR